MSYRARAYGERRPLLLRNSVELLGHVITVDRGVVTRTSTEQLARVAALPPIMVPMGPRDSRGQDRVGVGGPGTGPSVAFWPGEAQAGAARTPTIPRIVSQWM